MQKISTPLNKTDVQNKKTKGLQEMHPAERTHDNILKCASAYRAQQIDKNQYVDMILN